MKPALFNGLSKTKDTKFNFIGFIGKIDFIETALSYIFKIISFL
jgi:hypothetical protein